MCVYVLDHLWFDLYSTLVVYQPDLRVMYNHKPNIIVSGQVPIRFILFPTVFALNRHNWPDDLI